MFGIFKSKYNLINSGLMKGMTDVHSHVLPGVDDGSPDINASLSLLRYMESIGLRKVWLTPHIMEDYPTPNKKLRQQLDVLKTAYSGPLDLRLSSEYMMDAAFTNKLDGEVLPLGSSHLLVETSYMYPPPGLPDILMKVWNAGYQPVIAHRALPVHGRKRLPSAERERLQLSTQSDVTERLLWPAPQSGQRKAVKQKMYDFVGTDLHHLERYRPMLDQLRLTRRQLEALEGLIANNARI